LSIYGCGEKIEDRVAFSAIKFVDGHWTRLKIYTLFSFIPIAKQFYNPNSLEKYHKDYFSQGIWGR
jgi:hypothetical protein